MQVAGALQSALVAGAALLESLAEAVLVGEVLLRQETKAHGR